PNSTSSLPHAARKTPNSRPYSTRTDTWLSLTAPARDPTRGLCVPQDGRPRQPQTARRSPRPLRRGLNAQKRTTDGTRGPQAPRGRDATPILQPAVLPPEGATRVGGWARDAPLAQWRFGAFAGGPQRARSVRAASHAPRSGRLA